MAQVSVVDYNYVKQKQDELIRKIGKGNADALQCILAVVAFILSDPVLRTIIVTFLQTIQTEITLQKTALQLIVAQSTVALALINTELQVVLALVSAVTGMGGRFPLDKLMGCPPLAEFVHFAEGKLKNSTSSFPNPITRIKTTIRDLQYKEALLQQKINQLNTAIGQLDLGISQIQALIDFVNAVASFPGILTLPLT